mgnify:CR=1 FL=1
MNLPNPTQGMSTEAQLLGDLIEQSKKQGVYQEVQLKTDQYSQKPGGVAFKRSEKTSKNPCLLSIISLACGRKKPYSVDIW